MQTTTITIYLICYVMVFILSWIGKSNNNLRLINEGVLTSKPGNLIGSQIIGILWLGLVPLILLKHDFLTLFSGLNIPAGSSLFLYILIFILVISMANKQSKNDSSRIQASTEDIINLSPTFYIRYFIGRSLFLFVYELWFRGFLLFDSINRIGMPTAVTLNVFLYALLHIFNSKKEMLACIPFGLLLCFLSILFNAAWPAIILHISFSLIYELNIYRSYLYSFKTSGQ